MAGSFFKNRDFLQATHVSGGAAEAGCKKGVDQFGREGRADNAGPKAENVHVIVLHTLVG